MKTFDIKKFFKIKTFTKELKISPLFIEATSSVIAGFILLFFGIIFFSNSTFQYTLFTKARNAFTSEKDKKKMISGIYTFGIDYEAALKAEDINDSSYDMLKESISIISQYAKDNPEKRIIIGLDIIMLSGLEGGNGKELVSLLLEMPDNLYIVLGGTIFQNTTKISFLRIEYIKKNIIMPISEKNSAVSDRIFIGAVHYLKSGVKNGLDRDNYEKIALGYKPLYNLSLAGQGFIFSLPAAMFLIGTLDDASDFKSFSADFTSGVINCENDIQNKFKIKTGYDFNKLRSSFRYNFFSSADADGMDFNSLSLSNFSSRYSFRKTDHTINEVFKFFNALNPKKKINIGKIEYFFIYKANLPDYAPHTDDRDEIITPASSKNAITYEYDRIHGVMAHVTALSNLKNSYFISDVNPLITVISMIIICFIVFFTGWNNNFKKGLIIYLLFMTAYITGTFILFVNGYFFPLRMTLAASSIIFALCTLIRFFYTTKKINISQLIAQNIFSPVQLKYLEENAEALSKPSVKKDSIIFILFLKDLPPIGETENSVMSYEMLYEKYINIIFGTIENYGGSHDILYTDGIIGFWNVLDNDENNYANAYNCALKCIANASLLQKYINSKKINYKVFFDICIHKCDVFAGIVGPSSKKDFAISSPEVTFAVNTARNQTADEKSGILLTKEFYHSLKDLPIKEKADIFNYNGRKLYKIKL